MTIENLYSHMQSNNLPCHKEIYLDGQLHRYGKNGPNDSKDEWYIGYQTDQFIYCTYGSWSSNEKFTYRNGNVDPELLKQYEAYVEQQQKDAYEKIIEKHSEAKVRAQEIYNNAITSSCHPYRERKLIQSELKVDDQSIIVPFQNINGEIETLQFINQNGDKKFLAGGKAKGNFHLIGEITKDSKIYLCEGFATGDSINQATGNPVVCCGSMNNIIPVTTQIRVKYPNHSLYLCQDIGDEADKISHQWKEKFQETVYKPINNVKGYDFNDHHKDNGLDFLRNVLNPPLPNDFNIDDFLNIETPEIEWLIPSQIAKGTCTMIHAKGGVGKSRYMTDLMFSFIERDINEKTLQEFPKENSSIRFMWWNVPKISSVYYIDTELQTNQLQKRLKDTIKRRKSMFKPQDFKIFAKQQSDQDFNLYNRESRNMLDRRIKDFDVIVIDNLQNALEDDDLEGENKENQAKYWFIFYRWIKEWLKKGKTFFLIHHTNKAGSYRGTSRIEGDVDNIVVLTDPKDKKIDFKKIIHNGQPIQKKDIKFTFCAEIEKGRDIEYCDRKNYIAILGPETKFRGGWILYDLDEK